MKNRPLSTRDSLGTWLKDPVGGPLLNDLLAEGGHEEKSLRPARMLPLDRLVAMSEGRFPQTLVDELTSRYAAATTTHGESATQDRPAGQPEPAAATSTGDGRFTGRTVVVTGAASGIGRATADRIVAEGGTVVAVDRVADGLEQLAAAAGAVREGAVVPVVADITDAEDVARIAREAGDAVDGLANVAGIMDGMTPLHEVSDDLWRRVFAVNVDGSFLLARALLPAMLASGSGSVVNVASEAALRGNAAGTAYTASKHAVVGMTKSAAFMYGPEGVRFNAVAPGPVATGISGAMASPFAAARLGEFLALIPPVVGPEALAATITWLLSADSANVNGVVLASDGGWSVQ